jgi:hypothetical protein
MKCARIEKALALADWTAALRSWKVSWVRLVKNLLD